MSSISNIPYTARSVNGIITLSDGVAVIQNGDITNVNNLDTTTLTTDSLTSNDFTINTNLDLTGDTSKIQFLYGANPNNTVIDRNGIDTTSAFVENFTYTNISNDISILNWNAGVPNYPSNGAYVNTYYGSSGTDVSGWVFDSVLSNEYIAGILKGTFNGTYYVTYFPVASNQAFVLNPSDAVIAYMTSKTYNLVKGQYLFSFYTQCADNGAGGLVIDASIKDSSGNIVEAITGINPVAIFPIWLFSKISVVIPSTGNYTIEFRNRAPSFINGAYILITGIELSLQNSIVVQDISTNEISVISGGQSTLNNLFINKGITVNDGGLTVLGGGINTNTTYGSNNTTINSTMGEIAGASASKDNISVGIGSGQSLTSGKRNIFFGVGCNSQATTVNDNIVIGYNASTTTTDERNVIIGNRQKSLGTKAVIIGDNTANYVRIGTVGNFSVSIGADCMGSQVYNGFGTERKNEYSVAIGWQSQQFTADYYNTSVGTQSLYNMNGSIASGFNTRYNCAFGFQAGMGAYNTRNRVNNCTFLGALTDFTVNNISNSTAIGYNCKVDASNIIQLGSNSEQVRMSGKITQSSIGANQNEFQKSNFTEILLNGSPIGGGTQNLASVLGFGNKADQAIDMSYNNIININELKISKTTSGASNPSILLQCNNDDQFPENFVVNRYSNTPAINDQLFALYVNGYDASLSNVEYTRINNEILDPLSTAPKGQMRFYTRGGTNTMSVYEIMNLQDTGINVYRQINFNNNAVRNASTIIYNTQANDTYTMYIGSISSANELFAYRAGAFDTLTIGKGNAPIANIQPYNTIIGGFAGESLSTSGHSNTVVGMGALRSATSANSNVALGYNVLRGVTTGERNIGIGYNAGNNTFGGGYNHSNSIFIGYATSTSTSLDNSVLIGNLTTCDASNTIILGTTSHTTQIAGGFIPATVSLAITGTTTLTNTSLGSTTYLVSSTASSTINLPPVSNRNGAMITIYNLSSHKHTLASTANIGGGYGSNATTQVLTRGQGYVLVLNSSQWHIIQVFGVPFSYVRYHTVAQTVGTTAVVGLFNTAGGDVNNGNTAWNMDTWNGQRLDYNATTGLFTNNTGEDMTIQVEVWAWTSTNTATRYVGINPLGTRNAGTPIIWYSGAPNSSTNLYVNWTFYLGQTETFNIKYQASTAGIVFGTSTAGADANRNRIVITRIG